jgi:hypothetical protein
MQIDAPPASVTSSHILLHVLPIDGSGMDFLERKNMGGDEKNLSGEIPNARWDEECGRPVLKWNEIENTIK